MILGKRIFYLTLQMTVIIGSLFIIYYFVWDEQMIHSILFTVMVISISLLGYSLNKKFKRDNKQI